MPYVIGNGGIWAWRDGDEVMSQFTSDAAGLALAKAYVAAAHWGFVQVPPGLEGLTVGTFPDSASIWTRAAAGGLPNSITIGGLIVGDSTDPTRRSWLDCGLIATATARRHRLPNWDGYLLAPASDGLADQFLMSAGAGVQQVWATPATAAAVIQHDLVLHTKPFSVSIGWVKNTTRLTSAAGFGNVKVGDFIYLGSNTTVSTQGARVASITDTSNIDADLTKSILDSDLVGVSAIFTPGDHWENTLALNTGTGAGLFLTLGRGTYNATNSSGTFQEIRGPVRWTGQGTSSGILTDFRVMGSGSTATLSGFCIDGAPSGAGGRVYFHVAPGLAGNSVLNLPDIDPVANVDTIAVLGLPQTMASKTLSGANTKIVTDGSTNNAVFQSGGGADFLSFSAVGTTLRNVSSPDYAGRNRVEGAPVTFGNGDTTPSVALSRVFKTNNAGGTTITALDDGVSGQEITIIATDAVTTLQHAGGGSLRLQGSINYTMGVDDTIRLVYDGTNWYENGRTVI